MKVHTAAHTLGNVKLMSVYLIFSLFFFPRIPSTRYLCYISYLHTSALKTQKTELFISSEILLCHSKIL